MATLTLKTLTIMALAGTSLSGCAVINGAADGAWSGTKYVAKFVSYPVRSLLRDAPKDDVQFAEADVDATTTEGPDDKIDMMAETIVAVKQPQVMGETTAPMPISTTTTTQTTMSAPWTGTPTPWTGTTTSSSPIEIIETVAINEFQSVDVLTVGPVSYVRTAGVGSLEDWRTCDIQAGGFWTFDAAKVDGTLNPEFANCMQTKDYVQETELNADMLEKMGSSTPAPALKPLP